MGIERKAGGSISSNGKTFEGFAAMYGNVDSHNDIIVKGAFNESIEKKHKPEEGRYGIKVFSGHHTAVGKVLEIEDREDGLWVKGNILDTREGQEVITLIDGGVIEEMSVGFYTKEYRWVSEADSINGEDRVILKADLWEVSAVVWGANNQTSIEMMKSALKKKWAEEKDELRLTDEFNEGAEKAVEATTRQEFLDSIRKVNHTTKSILKGINK